MTRLAYVSAVTLFLIGNGAEANKKEIGVSIEPCFALLPAVAPASSSNTLAPVLGGTLGVEYYVLNDVAVLFRGGYVQSFGDSLIGDATIDHIRGQYYFSQSAALASAGVRAETPPMWLPVSFFVTATFGGAVLIQTNQDLRNESGSSYGLTISPAVRVAPLLNIGGGISGRVSDQIRLALEPTLTTIFAPAPIFGFSLTASLTFLFYP